MKVFGAGFGRTGTLSLKEALEKLGFAPCYHMRELVEKGGQSELWMRVLDGETEQLRTILDPYEAGVDVPVSLYTKELMAIYPNAKFILTERDPERWYASALETIYKIRELPRWMERLPRIGGFMRYTRLLIWDGFFDGRFTDKPHAIAQFEQHNARMRETIPADKLLIFQVKDGWEPLCAFLDVPVPNEPFPHLNDREEMRRRTNEMKVISRVLPIVGGGLLLGLIGWLISLLG